MTTPITIISEDPIIESELSRFGPAIGNDLLGYRNHVYRVLTYAMHFLAGDSRWRPVIAFALVYHDIGMWTDGTLAYLEPSEVQAERARADRAPHIDAQLLRDIIHWHHKMTAFTGPHADVVNAVRKADWIDASQGMIRKGLSRAQIAATNAILPGLGFPETLMRLAADLNGGNRTGGLMRVLSNVYKF